MVTPTAIILLYIAWTTGGNILKLQSQIVPFQDFWITQRTPLDPPLLRPSPSCINLASPRLGTTAPMWVLYGVYEVCSVWPPSDVFNQLWSRPKWIMPSSCVVLWPCHYSLPLTKCSHESANSQQICRTNTYNQVLVKVSGILIIHIWQP